jgi:transaldolase
MTDSIARLRAAGVSVWLDDLSRERLTSGSLAALRGRGVSRVTTNPAIFARAITDSNSYADQVTGPEAAQDLRGSGAAGADHVRRAVGVRCAAPGGISINVTLIFSLARYGEVIEAFLTGMEQARAAGRDLSGIASVASFFVSRGGHRGGPAAG